MMNGHHARTNNKNRRLPSPSPESSSGRSMLVSRPNGGSDYRGLSDCQTASQSIAIHRGSRATSSTDTKMVVGSFAASTVLSTTASFISSVSSVASSWSRDDVDQVERLRADISTSRRSGRLLRFLSSRQIADEIERVRQVRLWKYDQSRILRDHEAELAAMERSLLERLSQKPPTEKHDELPSKNIVGNPPHRREEDHDDTARCFSVASRPQSLRGAITDLHPNRSSTERQEPWGVAGIVSVLMQLDNSLKTRVLEFVPDECFANLPQLGAYAVKGASVPVRLCFGPARPTSAFATNTTSTSPSLSSLHHSHMNTQNGDDQKKIVDQLLNAGGHRWGLGESRGILIHRAAADYVGHKDGSVLGGEDCDVDIAFGRACLAAAARRRVALTAERACDASSDRYGDRKRRRSVSLLLLPRGGDRNRGRLSPLHHDSGYLGNEWNRNEENNKDGSYNGAIGPDGCLHHFDDDDEEDHECAICDWNNRRADVHILSLKDAGQPWTAHLDEAHRDFYQQGAEGNGRCILSGRRSTCSSGVGDKSSAQGRHRAVLEAYCERPLPTTCEQQSRAPLSFEWLDQTGVEAQVKHLAVVAPLLDSLLDFARPNQESQFDAEETQSSSAFEFVDEETPAMMTSLTSDLAAERLSSFLASPTSRVVGGGAIGSSRLSPLKQQKGRAKASRRGAFAMGTVYEEIPSGDENSRAAATDERLRHHLAPTSSSSMIKQLKGENKFLLSVPIGSLQCPDSPLHEAADLQLVSDGSSSSGDDMELRCRGTGAFELDVQDDGEDSFDDSKGAELSAGDAASSSRTAPSDRHVGLVGRTDLGVRQSSGSAPSISPSDGNSDIVVASCGEPAFPLPHLGTQNKGRWPGQPKSSPSSSSQFCHSLPAMALRKTTTSKKKGRMMAVTVPDNSMLAHLPATAFKFPLVPLSLTLTPTYFPADCDCCSNSLCQKCSDLPCRDAVVDGLDFLNDGHRSLMKLDERVDSWVRHTGPSRCRMMQAFDWARRGCESINPTRGVSLPPTETHALLRQMSAPEGSDLMSPFASPSSRVAGSGRRRRQQKLDDQSQQHGLRMGAGNSSSIRHHAANMPTPLAGTRSQSTIAAVAGEAAAGGLLSNITAVDNLVDFSTLEVLKLNPVLLNNANTSRARHWLHMVAEAASHRQTKPTTTFPGLGGGLQTLSTAAGLHICLEQRKLVNASSMLLLERNFVSSSMRKQCQHSVTLLAENLRETLTWSEADALSGLRLR